MLVCQNVLDFIEGSVANNLPESSSWIHTNINKECSTKQSSLDATIQKNDENFLDTINAWCLENNYKTSMITAKTNTLSFMEKHLRRLF